MPDSYADDIEKNEIPFLIPPPITLSWSNLAYRVKEKNILDGVSGQLASGQLLAVMGPSGKVFYTIFTSVQIL
jgi:ABC-type transporter Mla maintaining outer membrane lipid asymmetry ATPase subunit MlaF